MHRSKNRVALGAVALALAGLSVPTLAAALGQERPESILPPGFGEPPPQPAPTPALPSTIPGTAPAPAPPPAATDGASPAPAPLPGEEVDPDATEPEPIDPAVLAEYELPSYARRSLDRVGVVGAAEGGFAPTSFGASDGRFLEELMGRLDAPIASRWLSIALRRMLASQIDTPDGVNGADFAAERAWLLLRMGEAVVARAMVASVDTDSYTPKLFEAAMQTALATGDPAAVCPVVPAAQQTSRDRAWILVGAICAGLSGVPGEATPLIKAARRSGAARGIDLLLAEKVVGAGAKGQQAVTIEWPGVDRLSIWRYGLATATGVEIPDDLFATAGPQLQYWRAQSAVLEPRVRATPAELAAAQGVLSSAALVDLYGQIEQADDSNSAEASIARDLRTAYTDPDRAQRLAILAQLWNEPKTSVGRYARLVLTARAATAVPPKADTAEADRLIASMLTAGLYVPAMRWSSSIARGSDGWAMLMLANPDGARQVSRGDVDGYRGRATDPTGMKARMLAAGLAGMGRLDSGDATAFGVDLAAANNWTRAIDRAAAAGQPGTVLLLAATGMQTRDWRGVSPVALYHIVSAMNRVGLEAEARMIAVEALTRL